MFATVLIHLVLLDLVILIIFLKNTMDFFILPAALWPRGRLSL
jgi:hypothetical protein